ncbi:SDR family oxidoreductase [Burkholderia alba]|uniref:SDR family oxidoreductase n=1 Tax=Burkholderia alba TaxID=2683677 RepID=UPI002B05DBA1|nr:SDR family oxidoreductase [Burkholderia alba]
MQPLSDEAPLALFESVHTETAVTSGDVTLAVKTWGDPAHPAVVLVHGYPDNSSVWHAVAPLLAKHHYVIAYDVRGAGLSSAPPRTSDYRLARLVDDFSAVIDTFSPERAVHVIAHDWGSIQAWECVTEPRLAGRIASYTSCAGPCLDHVGYWLRHQLTHPSPASFGRLGGQLLRSWYVYFFHLPLLPELSWRLWLGRAWPRLLRSIERTALTPRPTQADDGARGVRLYRANFIRCLFAPRERYAQAPVQVIVPLRDKYVSPALSEDLSRWVPRYYRRTVAARHWLPIADPDRFAALAHELIDAVDTGVEPPALARARRRAGTGPFSGKLAVITGAGSGIGRSAAVEFAKQGAAVVAVDIDPASAERTALLVRLLGVDAYARGVDVGAPEAMESLVDWVGTELGGADIVINNAGIGMAGGILDTTAAHWERILHVNVWGVIHGSRLFAKQMAARGTGGHIVNTASAAAFGPARDLPAYATTKAAVLMLSECMRAELADHGIGVTAVCPGFAETGIMAATQYAGASAQDEARLRQRATKLYQMRGLKPETVAKAMTDAVLRNRPLVSVGAEAHAMRFVGRFAPWLGRLIARINMASH